MIDKYKQIKKLVQDELGAMELLFKNMAEDFDCPNMEFSKDIMQYLLGDSKQIRSCLTFLVAKALSLNPSQSIIKLAATTEIIHNATLIHDDVIDEANIRRGHTSLHNKYGSKIAVLGGDYLLSLGIKLITELPPNTLKNFSICLENLCKGEIRQYFTHKTTPTLKQYLKKSEDKSATLFVASLKSLTDILAAEHSQTIEKFAKHFGLAFQIRDDLKNFDKNDTNKPALIDIENGIFTAPVILTYGEGKDLSAISPSEIYDNSIINLEKTKELLSTQIKLAKNEIKVLPQNTYTQAIYELCELLKN